VLLTIREILWDCQYISHCLESVHPAKNDVMYGFNTVTSGFLMLLWNTAVPLEIDNVITSYRFANIHMQFLLLHIFTLLELHCIQLLRCCLSFRNLPAIMQFQEGAKELLDLARNNKVVMKPLFVAGNRLTYEFFRHWFCWLRIKQQSRRRWNHFCLGVVSAKVRRLIPHCQLDVVV